MKKMKRTAWLISVLMCAAPIASISARPNIEEVPNFLESTVPSTFGEWRMLDEPPQIVNPAVDDVLKKIYREWLSRTYVNAAGDRVMLSMARSGNQIGIQQAHVPDVCYPAQGFQVASTEDVDLSTAYGPIPARRLTTSKGARQEPVTYWLTMGNQVVKTQWEKRWVQIRSVLTGESPGGLLFRVSAIDREPGHAFAIQERFVGDMMSAVSPEARRKLSGLGSSL